MIQVRLRKEAREWSLLANNGKYSDCRVWAPFSDRRFRDVARLVKKNANEVLRVDLETVDDKDHQVSIARLREFHARHRTPETQNLLETNDHDANTIEGDRKPKKKDPFKPVPPDFPA